MGSIGGALWHGFKGYRNSPRGERIRGMITTVKVRAPVLGGNFAVWSGMFNASDCLIAGMRGKEDPWNAIMAGASTGGLLAIRSGPRAMMASAVVGGIILGVMEGVAAMMTRANADAYKPVAPQLPDTIPKKAEKVEKVQSKNQEKQEWKEDIAEIASRKRMFGLF